MVGGGGKGPQGAGGERFDVPRVVGRAGAVSGVRMYRSRRTGEYSGRRGQRAVWTAAVEGGDARSPGAALTACAAARGPEGRRACSARRRCGRGCGAPRCACRLGSCCAARPAAFLWAWVPPGCFPAAWWKMMAMPLKRERALVGGGTSSRGRGSASYSGRTGMSSRVHAVWLGSWAGRTGC